MILLLLLLSNNKVLVPFVNYLVVIDAEGDRLLAKYFDGRSKGDQSKNESTLYKKTKTVAAKTEGIITLITIIIVIILLSLSF